MVAFSKEYKAEVVELIRKSGKSIGVVARQLDLAETVVRRWAHQAERVSGRGPAGALTTAEREELVELQSAESRSQRGPPRLSRRSGVMYHGIVRAPILPLFVLLLSGGAAARTLIGGEGLRALDSGEHWASSDLGVRRRRDATR
jgi:transposase